MGEVRDPMSYQADALTLGVASESVELENLVFPCG
jgi:hypothetical protein